MSPARHGHSLTLVVLLVSLLNAGFYFAQRKRVIKQNHSAIIYA
jgi:hypothetical protein